MYAYVKALHIIFIVTWFSGMFYLVRLFIYNTEAGDKTEIEKEILRSQFSIMIKRLWYGITWPSAVLTLIFGSWMLWLYGVIPLWLWIKIGLVAGLFAYHYSLHFIYREQMEGNFRFSSQQLRIWNEVATLFLIGIVMLVVVKETLSLAWGMAGLGVFTAILLLAIRIYKMLRQN